MKSLSASIIVLSAAVMITGGAFFRHEGSQLFVQTVGCIVGIIGLWAWWFAFMYVDKE